jgi:hypothetical protein
VYSEKQLVGVLNLMGRKAISLKEAAKLRKIPYEGLKWRIAESASLTNLYARTREDYLDERVEMLNETALSEPDVQRARLLCDNLKWIAAKVLPKKYGELARIEHTGRDGGQLALTDVGMLETAREILFALNLSGEAQKRIDDAPKALTYVPAPPEPDAAGLISPTIRGKK